MKTFQYFAHRPPSPITLLHDPLPPALQARISRERKQRKRWLQPHTSQGHLVTSAAIGTGGLSI
jgi:hypothetical protein